MTEDRSLSAWRILRLVLISVAAAAATCIVLAYADAWREKSAAARFVTALSTIQVGTSTKNDALSATRAFIRYENVQRAAVSWNVTSGITYTFQNRIMAFFHLARPKYLYGGLEFRNGIVISKSINFYQQPRSGVIVQEVLAPGGTHSTDLDARQLRTNAYGPGLTVISVHDDTSVPLSRRQLDWEVDLSCLTKIGSCGEPKSLLPGIFPHAK